MMGFNVEAASDNVKATADLTPYRERDLKAKQADAVSASAPAHKPPPAGGKGKVSVRVEDTKVTEVKFSDATTHEVVSRPVTSSVVFTPSKPSTAYAQHNAAGKTPSIYSLIKKNTAAAGGARAAPPAFPSLGAATAAKPGARNRCQILPIWFRFLEYALVYNFFHLLAVRSYATV